LRRFPSLGSLRSIVSCLFRSGRDSRKLKRAGQAPIAAKELESFPALTMNCRPCRISRFKQLMCAFRSGIIGEATVEQVMTDLEKRALSDGMRFSR